MILASALALTALSVLIVGMSSWGVLFPARLISFVQTFMHKGGFLVAVAVRLVLAFLLWMAAPQSHTPTTFAVLAVIALVAAIGLALIGPARLSRFIDRFSSWPAMVIRLQCLVGVAFGLFLIWSVSPVWAAS